MSQIAHAASAEPFRVEVPAQRERLPEIRDGLRDWLASVGCSAERAERLVLAANEAVTNSVEHAYPDAWPGLVWLRGDHLADGTIRVTVSDAGSWQPVRPDCERGRGVLMMQECGDDVRIDGSSAGTTVTVEAAPHTHEAPVAVRPTPESYEIVVRTGTDNGVIVEISGAVPNSAADAIRLRLLAAACGGLVPLTVDLRGVGVDNAGIVTTLQQLADAVHGVGGQIYVRPPIEPPAAEGAGSWDDVLTPLDIAVDSTI